MTGTSVTRRIYQVVEEGRAGDSTSRAFDFFILTAIAVSIAGLVLGTVQRFSDATGDLFPLIEFITVLIFTGEFVLRVWASVEDESGKYRHPFWGRLRYIVSPMSLVDLLAILPFYLVLIVPAEGIDLRFLRVVRLAARVVRLGRYSETMTILGRVLYTTKNELLAVIGIIALLLLMASSLMYFAENQAQPEKFTSIPASTYWAIITLTTVGYGDTVPVTTMGRMLTAMVAVLGIGLIALPAGILGNGFVEAARNFRQRQGSENLCPHCGEPLIAD